MAKKKSAAIQPDSESSAAAAAPPPRVRQFQAFERATVSRSALSFHEHNPRTIDPHAFKKLRDFVKKRGLLNSLIVNRRRSALGFPPGQDGRLVIVGGHQRTRAMDEITGFPEKPNSDYQVPIDLIEVEPGRESEIIVALNNPGLQGTWDYDLLSDLLTTPGVDPLATGFDRTELAAFLDEGVVEQILGTAAGSQLRAEAPIIGAMQEIAAAGTEANQAARQVTFTAGGGTSNPNSPAGQAAAGLDLAEAREAEIQGMRDRRKEFRETANSDANQAKFYIVLVADNDSEIHHFLTHLQLPLDQEFYSLSAVLNRMGYELAPSPDTQGEPSGDDPAPEIDETIAGAYK